jgi:hypothetical protein
MDRAIIPFPLRSIVKSRRNHLATLTRKGKEKTSAANSGE